MRGLAELTLIGYRIRWVRKRHGFSILELSQRSDVDEAAIDRLERGQCDIDIIRLSRIIRALDTTAGDILEV